MTDNIVSPGVYTVRFSRDRTETVEVVRTRRIGRGYSVIFADKSHMKLKQFQRTATPVEPTNGLDAPL
jgi:hypothetical protein